MANVNNPNGFSAVQSGSGGVTRQRSYLIQSGYDTTMYSGDLVTLTGGFVTRAVAGDRILGVFKGVNGLVEADGEIDYRAIYRANTTTPDGSAIECTIEDDPNIILEAQFVDGTAPTQAAVGTRYNADVDTGSVNTGRSAEGVTSTTQAAGTLVCIGFAQLPENEIGENARALFRIVLHEFNSQA